MVELDKYLKLEDKELLGKLQELEKNLVEFRLLNKVRKLKDLSVIKKTKKEIARINTVITIKKQSLGEKQDEK